MQDSLELRLQPDPSRYCAPRFLEDVAARGGDRTAIRFEERDLSYRELEHQARALARGLVAAGVAKGSRVAVWMANRPEWVVASFAVGIAGGVLIPVNTFATPDERDYILRHSDASLLLLQRVLLKRDLLAELRTSHPELSKAAPGALRLPSLPCLRGVVALGGESAGAVQSWDDLLAAGQGVPDVLLDALAAEVTPADDGVVIYTSGTTAHPKGVLHFQRAPVIQSWRFAEYMALEPDDVVWTAQPFFWTAGIDHVPGRHPGRGREARAAGDLRARGRPGADRARSAPPPCTPGPTRTRPWPSTRRPGRRDLSRVRKIEFSSPLAPLAGLEKDVWGTYGSYGLSETFTLASALPASASCELRRDTSGIPLPGMSIRIVDPETGVALAAGEKGEITVRGATLMRGYYKVAPEIPFDADGYFHTQDGGWLDADGYLHWTGRLSNLIKTGGANVSPLEIESALPKSPDLRVGLAVGVPHPVLGEAIVLCAVRADGASFDDSAREAEIRAALRGRVAAYKVPRRVLFFDPDELDYTANQKIQVGPLREAALARLQREGAEIEGFRYVRPVAEDDAR